MLKILVITPWFPVPETSYAGIFVAQQALALERAGHRVQVLHLDGLPFDGVGVKVDRDARRFIAASSRVPYRAQSFTLTSEYIRLPFFSPARGGFYGRAEAARLQLDEFLSASPLLDGFDVIHSHVTLPAGYSAISRGLPVVNTEHYTGVSRVLGQESGRQAFLSVTRHARMVCVSKYLREEIYSCVPETRDQFDVIPNMVDFSGLDYSKRDEIGRRWIYVGSLSNRKNPDRLLRVFRFALARGMDADLTVVGSGELEPKLLKEAVRLKIDDRVNFVGALGRSETVRHIRESDLMVHLSSKETFGLTAVEAIAAGLAVVTLENGGAQEAWGKVQEHAGRILSIELSDEAIADHIVDLCDNVSSMDSEFAASWVRQQYSADRVVNELTRTYAESLSC